jgi:DHA1 family tetracycline resistance protein-like MFS transporter
MRKNLLATIFVIVFVDLLGFSLILPLLPYYAESFGATATVVGLLVASYAAAQFIGAPILGRLSDRRGRRPILLLSVGGTFLGFILLGLAEPLGTWLARQVTGELTGVAFIAARNTAVIALLFLSRILDGLTGGNISVAQSYIADVTDARNRARGLGLIGAAFGLGFIIGPAVGGALSRFGYAVPAFAAATLSFANLIAIAFWLPESLSTQKRAELARNPRTAFSIGLLLAALRTPALGLCCTCGFSTAWPSTPSRRSLPCSPKSAWA